MPTFEIPDGPTTVVDVTRPAAGSKDPARGAIVFNVTNKSSEGCDGRLSVQASGASKPEWFSIEGDREKPFAAGETHSANVKIAIPNDVAGGDYPFQLRIVAVNDPDNDHAEGPVTTAKLPAQQVVEKKGIPWWVWLIIGLVVLIALGVGGYLLFGGKGGDDDVAENKTETVTPAAVPDFTGKLVEQAKAAAEGYDIAEFAAAEPTGKPPRTILSQNPLPGAKQPKGSLVKVTFDPGVVVPPMPGNATFANAPNVLRGAKLEPGNFLCDPGSGPNAPIGRITGFSPSSGTTVASGTKVNMLAIQAEPCPRIIIINPNIFVRQLAVERAERRSIAERIR